MIRSMLFCTSITIIIISGLLLIVRQRAAVNSGIIAFISQQDSQHSLHTMLSDGSSIRQLAASVPQIASPAWSPDGEWISFAGEEGLYRVRPNGSDLQFILREPDISSPTWSPDGRWIAFAAYWDDDMEIYRVRVDGTDLQQLTANFSYSDGMPAWSPDGEWIAFVSDRLSSAGIFRMRPDGSAQKGIYIPYRVDNWLPRWSPDSQTVVFVSNREQGVIFRIPVNGSPPERLLKNMNADYRIPASPVYSADGEWIALTTWHDNSGTQIYKARPDGSELTQLTHEHAYHKQLTWSPPVNLPWRGWLNMLVGLAFLIMAVFKTPDA